MISGIASAPYVLKMRTAREVPTPCECRKTMISRTAFCSRHASMMRPARTGPIPSTDRRRAGSRSMTSNTSVPKAWTRRWAKCGPIPFTRPEPRYFSMPSMVLGATVFSDVAVNCTPWTRSFVQLPPAWMNSPGAMAAACPTTVTSSRRPRICTRRTEKPFSSLWKVTRSTDPVRWSPAVAGASRSLGCSGSARAMVLHRRPSSGGRQPQSGGEVVDGEAVGVSVGDIIAKALNCQIVEWFRRLAAFGGRQS